MQGKRGCKHQDDRVEREEESGCSQAAENVHSTPGTPPVQSATSLKLCVNLIRYLVKLERTRDTAVCRFGSTHCSQGTLCTCPYRELCERGTCSVGRLNISSTCLVKQSGAVVATFCVHAHMHNSAMKKVIL
jgi:hypothetical protein